jgi:hypothetical protein
MFGHQDDVIKKDQKSDAAVPLPDSALSALTSPPATTPPTNSPTPPASTPAITTSDNSPAPDFYLEKDEGVTLDESAPTEEPKTILDEPKEEPLITKVQAPASPATNVHTNDLLDIKHEALHDLSPLVDKLDLDPEEKFKTVMMLIQASDEQALIPQAYELAKNISDEKAKAQALLDVVNEINYFTQKDAKD